MEYKYNKYNKYNKYIYQKEYQKIDIVYTYVNNTDIKWQKKYFKYNSDIDSKRFNYNDEIIYSLLTVQKFFSWVNKIYIVNDNQKFNLDFLDKIFKKKIVFIDHKDIIPKKYLPTFNSRVIECFIWKIKNLTDYFLYLNDDIFFGNYIYYSDFFTENNIFKNFGYIKYIKPDKNIKKDDIDSIKKSATVLTGRRIITKIFNNKFKKNYNISFSHTTHNFNKYACKYAYYMFINYMKKTFEIKIRKYNNNNNNNINTKMDFCFLTLIHLVQHHFKLVIQSHITKYGTSQDFTNEHYDKLINLKPKIINLNNINDKYIDVWDKFRKNYLNLFNNNTYDNLIRKIENDIKDIDDVT